MTIPVSAWSLLIAHLELIQFSSQQRQLAGSTTESSPNLPAFCTNGL